MNTQQLKELALDITKYLFDTGSADEEATSAALKLAERKLRPIFKPLEAAERERDELRSIAESQSKLAGANAARKQRKKSARLKAAAVEPVAFRVIYNNDHDCELYTNEQEAIRKRRELDENGFLDVRVEPLRTTAQPAVLPPKLIEGEESCLGCSTDFIAGYNHCWVDASAMGVQPQPVVELPALLTVEQVMHQSGFDRQYSEGWSSGQASTVNDFIHSMNAAGVKWVQK